MQLPVHKKYDYLINDEAFHGIILPEITRPMASTYADAVYRTRRFHVEKDLPQEIFFKYTLPLESFAFYVWLRISTQLSASEFLNMYHFDGSSLPDQVFLIKLCFLLGAEHPLLETYRERATFKNLTGNPDFVIENDETSNLLTNYYDVRQYDIRKTYRLALTVQDKEFIDRLNEQTFIYSYLDTTYLNQARKIRKLSVDVNKIRSVNTLPWFKEYSELAKVVGATFKKIYEANDRPSKALATLATVFK